MDIMQQFACLITNTTMVFSYDLLFDGTIVGLTLEGKTSLTYNIHQWDGAS